MPFTAIVTVSIAVPPEVMLRVMAYFVELDVTVGVPLMTPVAAVSVRPAGSEGEML